MAEENPDLALSDKKISQKTELDEASNFSIQTDEGHLNLENKCPTQSKNDIDLKDETSNVVSDKVKFASAEGSVDKAIESCNNGPPSALMELAELVCGQDHSYQLDTLREETNEIQSDSNQPYAFSHTQIEDQQSSSSSQNLSEQKDPNTTLSEIKQKDLYVEASSIDNSQMYIPSNNEALLTDEVSSIIQTPSKEHLVDIPKNESLDKPFHESQLDDDSLNSTKDLSSTLICGSPNIDETAHEGISDEVSVTNEKDYSMGSKDVSNFTKETINKSNVSPSVNSKGEPLIPSTELDHNEISDKMTMDESINLENVNNTSELHGIKVQNLQTSKDSKSEMLKTEDILEEKLEDKLKSEDLHQRKTDFHSFPDKGVRFSDEFQNIKDSSKEDSSSTNTNLKVPEDLRSQCSANIPPKQSNLLDGESKDISVPEKFEEKTIATITEPESPKEKTIATITEPESPKEKPEELKMNLFITKENPSKDSSCFQDDPKQKITEATPEKKGNDANSESEHIDVSKGGSLLELEEDGKSNAKDIEASIAMKEDKDLQIKHETGDGKSDQSFKEFTNSSGAVDMSSIESMTLEEKNYAGEAIVRDKEIKHFEKNCNYISPGKTRPEFQVEENSIISNAESCNNHQKEKINEAKPEKNISQKPTDQSLTVSLEKSNVEAISKEKSSEKDYLKTLENEAEIEESMQSEDLVSKSPNSNELSTSPKTKKKSNEICPGVISPDENKSTISKALDENQETSELHSKTSNDLQANVSTNFSPSQFPRTAAQEKDLTNFNSLTSPSSQRNSASDKDVSQFEENIDKEKAHDSLDASSMECTSQQPSKNISSNDPHYLAKDEAHNNDSNSSNSFFEIHSNEKSAIHKIKSCVGKDENAYESLNESAKKILEENEPIADIGVESSDKSLKANKSIGSVLNESPNKTVKTNESISNNQTNSLEKGTNATESIDVTGVESSEKTLNESISNLETESPEKTNNSIADSESDSSDNIKANQSISNRKTESPRKTNNSIADSESDSSENIKANQSISNRETESHEKTNHSNADSESDSSENTKANQSIDDDKVESPEKAIESTESIGDSESELSKNTCKANKSIGESFPDSEFDPNASEASNSEEISTCSNTGNIENSLNDKLKDSVEPSNNDVNSSTENDTTIKTKDCIVDPEDNVAELGKTPSFNEKKRKSEESEIEQNKRNRADSLSISEHSEDEDKLVIDYSPEKKKDISKKSSRGRPRKTTLLKPSDKHEVKKPPKTKAKKAESTSTFEKSALESKNKSPTRSDENNSSNPKNPSDSRHKYSKEVNRDFMPDILCSKCKSIWNDHILNLLFQGSSSVTVNCGITYGAILCMNRFASTNFPNDHEEQVKGLLERADVAKNIKNINMDTINNWLIALLQRKKIKCCEPFRPAYKSKLSKKRDSYLSEISPPKKRKPMDNQDVVEKDSSQSMRKSISQDNPIEVEEHSPEYMPLKDKNKRSKLDCSVSKEISGHLDASALSQQKQRGCFQINQQIHTKLQGKLTNGEALKKETLEQQRILKAERSSLSLDVQEVYDLLPFDSRIIRHEKLGFIKNTTNQELLNMHTFFVLKSEKPHLELYYKTFYQVLLHRGRILLIPDGQYLAKHAESIRLEFNRNKINKDVNYSNLTWDDLNVFSTPDSSMSKPPGTKVPTTRDIISSFIRWKNSSNMPELNRLKEAIDEHFDPGTIIKDYLGLCIRIFSKYSKLAIEDNEPLRAKVFLCLSYHPSPDCLDSCTPSIIKPDISFIPPFKPTLKDIIDYYKKLNTDIDFKILKYSMSEELLNYQLDQAKKLKEYLLLQCKDEHLSRLLERYVQLRIEKDADDRFQPHSDLCENSQSPSLAEGSSVPTYSVGVKQMIRKLISEGVPLKNIKPIIRKIFKDILHKPIPDCPSASEIAKNITEYSTPIIDIE